MRRWRRGIPRNGRCNGEVDDHADCPGTFRRNPQYPVLRDVRRERLDEHAFKINYVTHRERQPGEHAGNGAPLVHALVENAHEYGGEQRGCGETERKRDHLCDEGGRVQAEVAGDGDGDTGGDTPGHQFLLFTDAFCKRALQQVVRHAGRDHQQQPGRCRQCGRDAAGGDQRDDPVRQPGDFRVGEHHDVAVDINFVGMRGVAHDCTVTGVGGQALAIQSGLIFIEFRFAIAGKCRAGGILDAAVPVVIGPCDQPGLLPRAEPVGNLGVGRAVAGRSVDSLDQVQARQRTHGRRGGVENGDEQQGITGRDARVAHARYREETHNDMRQAGRADHQRQRDRTDIEHRLVIEGRGVGAETQVDQGAVEFVQQETGTVKQFAAKRQLRQRVAGGTDGDKHGRYRVGEDQHAILCDLGIGNALHAAQHGIDEHDAHAYIQPGVDRYLEETGKDDTHAAHLPCDVGKRNEDQADDGDHARQLRVITVADEFRHGELAELAQVGRQQRGQQHVAAGPAHQVHATLVAHEADQAGHRYKGCGGHPVGRRGHAVRDRVNVFAGDIKFTGGGRA